MRKIDPRPLVAAAIHTPSGDNCQPFRYRWDGRHLDVIHIPERTHHVLDSGHHASRLTLGMVAESFALAAHAHGLQAAIERCGERPGTPWLRATLTPGATDRDPLYDGLSTRHTDRRLFQGGAVDAPVLQACAADVGGDSTENDGTENDGARVHVRCAAPRALSEWLMFADAALWRAPQVTEDALQWVRFNEAELRRRGDGVSWRNLGLPTALAAGVAAAQRLPWTLRAGAKLGGPRLTAALLRSQLASSAAIVTVTTNDDSAGSLVAAGRVALRVWVRLNLAGWAVQPMSLGPILAMAARDGTLPHSISAALGREMLAHVPQLRARLGLGADAWPAFMLRTGRNPPLPGPIRPPRRRIADVLSMEPGQHRAG